MRVLVLSFLLSAFVFAFGADAAPNNPTGPEVLVSVYPVHSIVADVMLGSGRRISVLLRGGSSPHTYALTPTDAAKLAQADVIFWVGPALEKFLVAPLANPTPHTRVLAFANADGVRLLPARTGAAWESNTGPNRSGGADGHIWLDPANAIAIARAAARVLGQADPKYARLYAANAEAFAFRLKLFDANLAEKLQPVRGRPYFVVHDGYQYFEAHYGLTPVGSLAVSSDQVLDARHVEELRARIKSSGAICILSTRELVPQLVSTVTQGTQVRAAGIEAIGGDIPAGGDLFQTLLSRIAGTFASCLGS